MTIIIPIYITLVIIIIMIIIIIIITIIIIINNGNDSMDPGKPRTSGEGEEEQRGGREGEARTGRSTQGEKEGDATTCFLFLPNPSPLVLSFCHFPISDALGFRGCNNLTAMRTKTIIIV